MPTITDLVAYISAVPGVASVREWQGDVYVVTEYRGNAKKPRTGGGEFRIYVETGKFGPIQEANNASAPERVKAAVLAALGAWRGEHGQEKGSRLAREES